MLLCFQFHCRAQSQGVSWFPKYILQAGFQPEAEEDAWRTKSLPSAGLHKDSVVVLLVTLLWLSGFLSGSAVWVGESRTPLEALSDFLGVGGIGFVGGWAGWGWSIFSCLAGLCGPRLGFTFCSYPGGCSVVSSIEGRAPS